MIETLIADNPRFHSLGGDLTSWAPHADTLRFMLGLLAPGMVTLETGCGQTTVVFAIAGTRHICITPCAEESERVRAYCAGLGLTPDLTFLIDSSDTLLPCSPVIPAVLDLVLIDGAHAFPAPILDWYYTARRLKVGGVVAVDDIMMPSVQVLAEFLDGEDEWDLMKVSQNTAFFRKLAEPRAIADWLGQRINTLYPWR